MSQPVSQKRINIQCEAHSVRKGCISVLIEAKACCHLCADASIIKFTCLCVCALVSHGMSMREIKSFGISHPSINGCAVCISGWDHTPLLQRIGHYHTPVTCVCMSVTNSDMESSEET